MLQPTHDAPVDQVIENDPFYGDLNIQDFQEQYRVPASVAPLVMERQLKLGLGEVNKELAEWKEEQEADGVDALPEELADAYSEAVFARAYAHLIPLLQTLYMTVQAEGTDGDLEANAQKFFARSDHFINAVMGKPEAGGISVSVL